MTFLQICLIVWIIGGIIAAGVKYYVITGGGCFRFEVIKKNVIGLLLSFLASWLFLALLFIAMIFGNFG